MTLSISSIRPASNEEWDRMWQACPYATCFQSREWAELWSVYTNGQVTPVPEIVRFSDDCEALLPISTRACLGRLAFRAESSPAGTYGGSLATCELGAGHALLLRDYLTARYQNLSWRLNPYQPPTCGFGFSTLRADETDVLDLRRGLAVIYDGMSKGHKWTLRKAQKTGIVIRQARDLSDWLAYYQVYKDSLRRWERHASSSYGWTFFEELFRRNSLNTRLWLALHGPYVIAGALCFYSHKRVYYWHGAALESYFSLAPSTLLLFEVIKNACEAGCECFDFNPSGGHEGTKAFKKRFGAQSLASPVFFHQTMGLRIVERSYAIAALGLSAVHRLTGAIDTVKSLSVLRHRLSAQSRTARYWEERARRYGRRSVLNLGHKDEEYDAVTACQASHIFPSLQKLLNGTEKLVLDLGCGTGRFTWRLAELTGAAAVGVDPVKHLLKMAPAHKAVKYVPMEPGIIPLPDRSADVVWVCLVMGGLKEQELSHTIAEIDRVMKDSAVLCLVENTSTKEDSEYWTFRTAEEYARLFPFIELTHFSDYYDLDERISIFAGRKRRHENATVSGSADARLLRPASAGGGEFAFGR